MTSCENTSTSESSSAITYQDIERFQATYHPSSMTTVMNVSSVPEVEVTFTLDDFKKLVHGVIHSNLFPSSDIILDGHILVIRYDGHWDLSFLNSMYEAIREMIPNRVIFIPNDVDMIAAPTDYLRTIRDRIDEMLAASDFDQIVKNV